MRIWPLLPVLLVSLTFAQPDVATHLGAGDLRVLEELVALALGNDADVLEASVALPLPLGDVLDIDIGASLHADGYGQVEPSFTLALRLDAAALLDREWRVREGRLREAEASVRVRVAAAFIAYRVALERAAVAALAVETAREGLSVAEVRYEMGTVIPADVLAARDRAAAAALGLLEANGEVVLAVERLAAAVGIAQGELMEALRSSE